MLEARQSGKPISPNLATDLANLATKVLLSEACRHLHLVRAVWTCFIRLRILHPYSFRVFHNPLHGCQSQRSELHGSDFQQLRGRVVDFAVCCFRWASTMRRQQYHSEVSLIHYSLYLWVTMLE